MCGDWTRVLLMLRGVANEEKTSTISILLRRRNIKIEFVIRESLYYLFS